MALLNLRQQLETKQTYTERLEFLLRQRTEKIDRLHGRLEAARTMVMSLALS